MKSKKTEDVEQLGVWRQIVVLAQGILLSEKRDGWKFSLYEVSVILVFGSIFIASNGITDHIAEIEGFENGTSVINQDSLTTQMIDVVPDNEFAKAMAKAMNKRLRSRFPKDKGEMMFRFHRNSSVLQSNYWTNPSKIYIGLILPDEISDCFQYTIKFNPRHHGPDGSERTTTLDTCRQERENTEEKKPGSCPVKRYYLSNALGIQILVQEAAMQLRDPSSEVTLDVNIQHYPKERYCSVSRFTWACAVFILVLMPTMYSYQNTAVMGTYGQYNWKRFLQVTGVSSHVYILSWIVSLTWTGLRMASWLTLLTAIATRDLKVMLLTVFPLIFLLITVTNFFCLAVFQMIRKSWVVHTICILIIGGMPGFTLVWEAREDIPFFAKIMPPVAYIRALKQVLLFGCPGAITWFDVYPGGKGETTFYFLGLLSVYALFFGIIAVFSSRIFAELTDHATSKLLNEDTAHVSDEYFGPKAKKPSSVKASKHKSEDKLQLIIDNKMICGNAKWKSEASEKSGEGLAADKIILEDICRESSESGVALFGKLQAISEISMELKEKEITVILGKAESGKTTLMSILAGAIAPTSGRLSIFGQKASTPSEVRKAVKNFCFVPQDYTYFESLTVKERLMFYGKLKGIPKSCLQDVVTSVVTELKFADKIDAKAVNLNEEDSCKLSVAMAFLGNVTTILLDEPTRDCGHEAKNDIWSFIENHKSNKTIVLSTSSADEAEVLGDRIAILDKGRLKCFGSSTSLTQTLGDAHYFSLNTVDPLQNTNGKIESDAIFEAAGVAGDDGMQNERNIEKNTKMSITKIKYRLPGISKSECEPILEKAEELLKRRTGFTSYGISTTSLNDVFQKITFDKDAVGREDRLFREVPVDILGDSAPGGRNRIKVMRALCLMRMRRLWRSFPQMYFMPIALICVLLGFWTAVEVSFSREHSCESANTGFRQLGTEIAPGKTGTGNNESAESGLFYPGMKIAVSECPLHTRPSLIHFVEYEGFHAMNYSGDYKELLEICPANGTAAAVKILEDTQKGKSRKLSASIWINETFVHIPAIIFKILQSHTEGKNSNFTVGCNYETFCNAAPPSIPDASLAWMPWVGTMLSILVVIASSEFVRDTEKNVKCMLKIYGVSPKMYAGSLWCIFGGISLLASVILVIILHVYQIQEFQNIYASSILLTTMFLSTFAALMFSVAISRLFARFYRYFHLEQALPFITIQMHIYVLTSAEMDPKETTRMFHYMFSVLNLCYVPSGVMCYMVKEYRVLRFRGLTSEGLSFATYNLPEIWGAWMILVAHCVVYWLAIKAADAVENGNAVKRVTGVVKKIAKIAGVNGIYEEEGKESLKECQIVNAKSGIGEAKKVSLTVNDKSFDINEGEIFGLVTLHTPKKPIWSNNIAAISGNAELESPLEAGYCPPVPTEWDFLTVKETLESFAIFSGVNRKERDRMVSKMLLELKLEENANDSVNVSLSVRKKLNYGIGMLGNPRLFMLDEPWAYMDSEAKQVFRNTIRGTVTGSRRAVVATKYALTELSVIATKVAVINNGNVKFLGSTEELKLIYRNAFQLTVTLKKSNVGHGVEGSNEINSSCDYGGPGCKISALSGLNGVPKEFQFIITAIPWAVFLRKFRNQGSFYLPPQSENSLLDIVGKLEAVSIRQSGFGIEGYQVEQASFEDIFINVPEILEGRGISSEVVAAI